MIKRVMIAAIALCVASGANAATVRFKQYQNPKDEMDRAFNTVYLDGVMEAYETVNVALKSDGKSPLYCAPPKLVVTGGQAADIMTRVAKLVSNPDEFPISILLLKGLEQTFPCGEQNK
jgi:hypothetical protein